MAAEFPQQQPGVTYLTEGGPETELMYKYGFELPEFALFPVLDQPDALAELRAMYVRYLDTAARHGFAVLIAGLDYRASPDWAALLGHSIESLAAMQLRAIDFLREVAKPYIAGDPVKVRIPRADVVREGSHPSQFARPRASRTTLDGCIAAPDGNRYQGPLRRHDPGPVPAMTARSLTG